MKNLKNICVFCSSSDAIPEIYKKAAVELGNQIVNNGWNLVFGGADVGSMGIISKTVLTQNRKVIGIIPEGMIKSGLSTKYSSELIITKDMWERKAKMESLSDVFCVLPGGFGTLEEMMEIITLKQLGIHKKPIIIFNINNFFENVILMLKKIYAENFAKQEFESLYYVASNIQDGMDYLDNYNLNNIPKKWY